MIKIWMIRNPLLVIYYFRWNFVGEDVHKRECNIYVDKFATTEEVQTLFGFALSYYRLK